LILLSWYYYYCYYLLLSFSSYLLLAIDYVIDTHYWYMPLPLATYYTLLILIFISLLSPVIDIADCHYHYWFHDGHFFIGHCHYCITPLPRAFDTPLLSIIYCHYFRLFYYLPDTLMLSDISLPRHYYAIIAIATIMAITLFSDTLYYFCCQDMIHMLLFIFVLLPLVILLYFHCYMPSRHWFIIADNYDIGFFIIISLAITLSLHYWSFSHIAIDYSFHYCHYHWSCLISHIIAINWLHFRWLISLATLLLTLSFSLISDYAIILILIIGWFMPLADISRQPLLHIII